METLILIILLFISIGVLSIMLCMISSHKDNDLEEQAKAIEEWKERKRK
jgi:hypothetical protein